jgi:hypothetical protein
VSAADTQRIAERLRDVIGAFDHDLEGALERLSALYDPGVVFRDPLQTLVGRDAFLAMNRRIVERARRVSFDVTEAVGGVDSFFLSWTMTYEPRRGPTIVFEGATRARVRGGLITEQRDYWDMLSSVAQSLPLVRTLYAALAPHLG